MYILIDMAKKKRERGKSFELDSFWKERTMTISLSITVGTLCRTASVAESMEAVASSRTKILFLLRRTLPRQKSLLAQHSNFHLHHSLLNISKLMSNIIHIALIPLYRK